MFSKIFQLDQRFCFSFVAKCWLFILKQSQGLPWHSQWIQRWWNPLNPHSFPHFPLTAFRWMWFALSTWNRAESPSFVCGWSRSLMSDVAKYYNVEVVRQFATLFLYLPCSPPPKNVLSWELPFKISQTSKHSKAILDHYTVFPQNSAGFYKICYVPGVVLGSQENRQDCKDLSCLQKKIIQQLQDIISQSTVTQ